MARAKFRSHTDELDAIAVRNGGVLRPEDVVSFAADPGTHLHRRFQWDDSEAARLYRLEQARGVIRAHVTMVRSGDDEVPVRAWVALTPDRGVDSYRRTSDVLAAEDWRRQMLADAKSELVAFKRKYTLLRELAAVFAAIDGL